MTKVFYIFIACIFLSFKPVVAEEAKYELGVGLMKFHYEEYDDNGVFLDGEYGYIPGVVIKRKQEHGKIASEWEASLYGNTIEYEGHTSNDVQLTTNSDAIIFDTHFKLRTEPEHGIYIGLGYRYWWRNIRPGYDINGDPVAGLLEHYYWFYSLVGYSASYTTSENVKVGLDLRYTSMINGKMDVDFFGYKNYDNTQVNLGNESGARFAFPIQIKMQKQLLTVSPYYEIIDIGRSNNVRVTSNGVPTSVEIYEPRSETRNIGIEVSWVW